MNERRAISTGSVRAIRVGLIGLGVTACTCGGEPVAPAPPDPAPVAIAPAVPVVGVLIVGSEDGEAGAPSVGRLEVLEPSDEGWNAEVVYDGNSRSLEDVIATPAGLVTLGAERAMVRAWHREDGAWSGDVVWAEDFGALPARAAFASRGTLRPGHEEIALAVSTHGIVASLALPEGAAPSIERVVTEPGTTIEALAVLDVAGDGTAEIVAAMRAGDSAQAELRSFVLEEGGATSERLGALAGRVLALALEPGPAGSRGILALVAPAEGAARVERLGAPGGEVSTLFTLEGGTPRELVASDLDADGAAELVVSQPEGVFAYHADGGWERTTLVERHSELGPPIAVIDLEQDGPAEVVAVWDATGEVVAYDGTSAHVLHTRARPSPRDHTRALRPFPR